MEYNTILALDQAYDKTGFSVYSIEDSEMQHYGLLRLTDIKGDNDKDEKAINVIEFIKRAITYYKIDLVVFEDTQSQKNLNTFKKLNWLQGAIKTYLFENNIPYSILSPSTWRSTLGIKGRGRVTQKKNAQIKVNKLYDIKVTEDEADAICIGLASCKLLHKDKLEINKE